VDIASPAGLLYSAEAVSLVVPAELGYLGVLTDHAPLIAKLSKGKITVSENSGQKKVFTCQSGFMEVLKNSVTLVVKQ
jgi:F-type H+-transporting ATPase subunit epsilon